MERVVSYLPVLPAVARLHLLQYDITKVHGGGTNVGVARIFYNGFRLIVGVTFGRRTTYGKNKDTGYWVMYEDGDFGWYADVELQNMYTREECGNEREKKGWLKARQILLFRKGLRYSLPPNF